MAELLAHGLLDAAETLLRQAPRSSAFRRRAVSTAYYAVFHALARVGADYLTHHARRTSSDYERVYRALQHGSLKQAFTQSPLRDSHAMGEIGSSVVLLQAERFRADYMPPVLGVFSLAEAAELVRLARQTIEAIERLRADNEAVRLLATALHFAKRNA